MAIQRLTAAYRSRSRPSSTLGAKASTMCPYYLDGDRRNSYEFPFGEIFDFSKAIRRQANCPDTRYIGYCAVFKVREEAYPAHGNSGASPVSRRRRAGLSKLNSMRGASSLPEGRAVRLARSGRHI